MVMGGDKRVEYWDSEQSRENSITYERATSLYHLLDSVAIRKIVSVTLFVVYSIRK